MIRRRLILLCAFFLVLSTFRAFAQPANDSCFAALLIPVGTTCVIDTFDNIGATAESLSVVANPGCGFYKGGDVWFKAVVPSSGNIRFEVEGLNGRNAPFSIYEGQCGNFTQIVCNSLDRFRTLSDTAYAGDTLHLRVWRYNNAGSMSFTVCAFEPIIPVNNQCADAIFIPTGSTCVMDTFTNKYATEEVGIAPHPGCGFYKGGDVWFKTVMPPSGALRVEAYGINGSLPQFALYSGTCGSFSLISCNQLNPDKTLIDSSLIGDTVTVRVFSYNNRQGNPFEICFWESPIASNDNCANAMYLELDSLYQPASMCDTFTNRYTTEESSSVAPHPGCGFYQGGDVWYKFVFPSSGSLQMKIESQVFPQMALYKGTCGAMTVVDCATLDPNRTVRDTSLSGDTVYLRVFNYNNEEGTEFSLNLYEPPHIPPNDLCANAIPLTPGNIIFSNAFASTDSAGTAENPNCGFYKGGDIWFTYLVPASGFVRIQRTNLNANINPVVQLYTGNCGSLTRLNCTSGNGLVEFTDTALAGETIYARVYKSNSRDGGTFGLCAYDTLCKPIDRYNVDRFICRCERISIGPNQRLTTNNRITESFKTPSGGDSVIVYRLLEADEYETQELDTICYGSSYLFPDSLLLTSIDSVVQHTSVLTSQYGCDSIVHTRLEVRPENSQTVVDFTCSGSTYYFPDGDSAVNVTAPVLDTSYLLSSISCDSLVIVDLQVWPTYVVQLEDSICSGSNYVLPDGRLISNITVNLLDTSKFSTKDGCDSLVVVDLQVLPDYLIQVSDSICQGTNYVMPDGDTLFNVQQHVMDSSLLFTFNSCDSMVVTDLFVYPTYDTIIQDVVCKGSNYQFPDGTMLMNADSNLAQTSLLSSNQGCDSVVLTQLTVFVVDTAVSENLGVLSANNSNATSYQWLDCDDDFMPISGETNQTLSGLMSNGWFAVIIEEAGCEDTSGCHFLLGVGLEENDFARRIQIYPNPTQHSIRINIGQHYEEVNFSLYSSGHQLMRSWTRRGESPIELDMSDFPGGLYFLQIETGGDRTTVRLIKE